MSNELKVAIEAAKAGAKEALTYFNKNITVKYKEDLTPTTIADTKTEEVIKSFISKRFPNTKFLAEESGGVVTEDNLWIIVPIDGTRSFTRGIPTWCVIVSLACQGEIVLTVVHYPFGNITYFCEKGKNAYVNNKRMHVSKVSDINRSYLGYGSLTHFDDKRGLINLVNEVGSARSWEATYSSCLVAEGKMDINVDAYGKVWDVAPFKLMIEEAGGKITRLNGDEWTLGGSGAVITNGLLHDQVIKILNK